MDDQSGANWTGWTLDEPAAVDMDPARIEAAIAYHRTEETTADRDLAKGLASVLQAREPAPWNEVLGPTKPRGDPNGLMIRHGRVCAAWGDTERVDMTFSATKSYLGVLAGVAVAKGLIRDVDDPARDYALDDGFESEQNRGITWRHLLQQSSEWEGTLWGKPDLVDRNRQAGTGSDNSRKGTHRDLQAPGSYYEYNDVRVNRLALSLTQVFGRSLADVLRDEVMVPIGASNHWEWHGYRNSWIDLDGERVPVVPGGGHWGGGLWIASRDHARFASLILQRGRWGDREILPVDWVDALAAPSPSNPNYGYLWWLNTDRTLFPSAPETSFFALGAGRNVVWIDRALDLIVVARWIKQESTDGFIGRVMESLG